MSTPCFYCGVNAWTSCSHREAGRKPPELLAVDKRELARKASMYNGVGYNFRAKRRLTKPIAR